MNEEREYVFNMSKSTADVEVVWAIGTDNNTMPYLRMDLIDEFNEAVKALKNTTIMLNEIKAETKGEKHDRSSSND